MTTFNDFWKEKAQKRRRSWAAKAKRFAEQPTKLEGIRKEVYLPSCRKDDEVLAVECRAIHQS